MNNKARLKPRNRNKDRSPKALGEGLKQQIQPSTSTGWTRDDLIDIALSRLSSEEPSRAREKLRISLKALSRLRFPGGKEVILQIPSVIARDLARGTLTRTGGVIRNAKGAIVDHLKDAGKLKQALKGPVLPLMLLDFAEGALLNQKLQEIQEQLSSLSQKVDQLQWAQMMLPFEKVAKLAHLDSTADREREMRQIQEKVDAALVLARMRLNDAWKSTDAAVAAYRVSSHRLPGSHQKARGEIFKPAAVLVGDAQIAVALLVLRSRLHEELLQPRAAFAASQEAIELATSLFDRLSRTLGKRSEVRRVNHIKTLFANKPQIQGEVIESANEILRGSGDLLSTTLFQFVLQDRSDRKLSPAHIS